jgi:ATP-dependent Zn protease
MNAEATAYHEAGHAVMTAACNRKIHSATIIPRDDAHGSVEHENPCAASNSNLTTATLLGSAPKMRS